MAQGPRTVRITGVPEAEQTDRGFVSALLHSETVGGLIALLAAVVAVTWATLDQAGYLAVQHHEIGPLDIEQWAADGALTIFFFLAGLELKRELVVGSLRRPADAAVPVAAAVCGVAVPALVYVGINLVAGATENLEGWAIPAATDIAFALAVLAVVGSSLPNSLRVFLLTLAVVDDFVVIVIIAVFYTEDIHLLPLAGAAVALAAYAACQRFRVRTAFVYLPLAVLAWWLVHESGVHATIAGVALGMLTRVRPDPGEESSPAERVEHRVAPISSSLAVPFFALMSAGVSLKSGIGLGSPLVLGVVLGLVVGKPVGILLGTWLVTRFTRAELDVEVEWRDLIGLAVLGGVGFTVSLLVADLSFDGARVYEAKTAVLLGSLAAALLGALVLGRRNRQHRQP